MIVVPIVALIAAAALAFVLARGARDADARAKLDALFGKKD